MPLEQRTAFFQKHIAELQEKERKIELAQQKNKKDKNTDAQFYESNFEGFGNYFATTKSNKFYFYNLNAVAKGSNEFKKIWGDRALNDNWRYGETFSNTQKTTEQQENSETEKANPRRFELAYYEEQIPKEDSIIFALKKDRDTASLGLGRMYDAYFQNKPLATKTLYDLVDNKPEDEVKLQALYLIFSMNHEKNPAQAERAKEMIIKEFPNTSYAIFVKNPRNTNFTESEEAVKKMYQEAYQFYIDEKFENSEKIVNKAIEKHPKDALIPKFELLKAFIIGKTKGKEQMVALLEQIVLNFERTNEGAKAKEILSFLKSKDKQEKTLKDKKIKEDKENNIVKEQPENEKIQPIEESEDERPREQPKIEIYPQSREQETPKKEAPKKEIPKRLERPVQTWERDLLRPTN